MLSSVEVDVGVDVDADVDADVDVDEEITKIEDSDEVGVLFIILESSEKKSIDFCKCCVFNLEGTIKYELCIINKIKSLYIIILVIWRQKKNGGTQRGIYFILFRSK